jgi:hypothetical protein
MARVRIKSSLDSTRRIQYSALLDQACWNFYVVRETSAKFCLRAADIKFKARSEQWIISPRLIVISIIIIIIIIIWISHFSAFSWETFTYPGI